MDENVVMAEKQPKLWLAILCAIGLGLAGCVLWGLLYYVGVIAWLAAFVIVIAAAWGYQKFNLKMDKKGYVIITVISLVEVILTLFIVLNITCMTALAEEGQTIGFFECFGLMFDVIGASGELKNAVIMDAVLSVVFIGIGVVSFYFMQRRQEKLAKQKEKKEEVQTSETTQISSVEDEKDKKSE